MPPAKKAARKRASATFSAQSGEEAGFGKRHVATNEFGVPPRCNANFAWLQHFIHHFAPQTALGENASFQCEAIPQVVSEAKDNMASFVVANGSMSSNQSGEGTILGSRQAKNRDWLLQLS